MVLHQQKAAQLRAKMAGHPSRQRRDHRGAFRRYPAFAAIAGDLRAQHQFLHHEALVSLEPRPRRHRRLDGLLGDAGARHRLAAATPLARLARALRLGSLLHAARLDARPALQPFEPRVLLAQLRGQPLLFRQFDQQLSDQRFELGQREGVDVGGRGHTELESSRSASGQAKSQPPPGLLPRLHRVPA